MTGTSPPHLWYILVRDTGGPVIWDPANQRHIIGEHPERGLTRAEVEQAMNDEAAVMVWRDEHDTWEAPARTRSGRWLIVAWAAYTDGRYPVHARAAGERARTRWIRRWRTRG